MNKVLFSTTAVALAVLLSACGGGDEGVIVDEREPSPSGASATMTVSAAGDVALNGVYTTNNVSLNNVTKVNPIGGDPETCRFRFSGLLQAGSTRQMSGDIRYIPANPEVRTTFVSIAGAEFRLQGTTGAAVDRTNNRVNYTGAVLTSTQFNNTQTVTITGSIPMLGNRPEGC